MESRKTALWIALLFLVPQFVFAQESASSSTTNGNYRWRTSTGVTDFNIEMRGTLEVTDDDKDIKSISDDGYLEINKTVFGSRRTIIVDSRGGGQLRKRYFEGRTEKNWEPGGRAWLAEILPDLVRRTTIGASGRVDRFFNKGGVSAVLEEIRRMNSDYTACHYANLLMKKDVPKAQYATIINVMAEQIDSDHYMSTFLKDNLEQFMDSREGSSAFFSALRGLDSDHYKTTVITRALDKYSASIENVRIILAAASTMESDHYQTEVLTHLLKQRNLSDELIAEMIRASRSIESDHYKTTFLTKALANPNISAAGHREVIKAIGNIESDHYITVVVKALMENKLTDELLGTLLGISQSIESDHYHSLVLTSIIDKQPLSDTQFQKLLEASSRIESDHYLLEVLRAAGKMQAKTEKRMKALIDASASLDSDHYLSQFLLGISEQVKAGSAELKDAYRRAAKKISSETYYGRALRGID